jgi:hypothetical protein
MQDTGGEHFHPQADIYGEEAYKDDMLSAAPWL